MKMKPVKWDVAVSMRDAVVFVLDPVVVYQLPVVHQDLCVTWWHALTCEVGYCEEDFILEIVDAPRQGEIEVED